MSVKRKERTQQMLGALRLVIPNIKYDISPYSEGHSQWVRVQNPDAYHSKLFQARLMKCEKVMSIQIGMGNRRGINIMWSIFGQPDIKRETEYGWKIPFTLENVQLLGRL